MNHNSESRPRPDADALLKEIRKEEARQGKLRVFLGYSPGVGKTYSMLLDAHTMKRRGEDAVVGLVETHGRSDTAELLKGLEIIPRKTGDYKGITLDEMDLDAILARKPAVVLVDELAHTNAPWSRHIKRYMDVEEILANGIDVSTTINVQHFESQNDVIATITGVKLQETVPDSLLDRADEVRVIDIPLEELFERLREGKVYVPDQARRAMDNFFQRGTLVALREITLNVVARKMGGELLNYMKAKAIRGSWPTTEKLMVCVAASPGAAQLVRKAYRMARNTNAEWYVVYVSLPALRALSGEERNHLAEAFRLGEEFGARIVTLTDTDIVPGLCRFAQENNIGHVIVGKPRSSILLGALRRSPVYRLIESQKDFDLYLVSPAAGEERAAPVRTKEKTPFSIRGYLIAVPALALATVLNLLLEHFVNPISLYSIYLIATIIIALFFGSGPSIWASILSLLAFDFFFTDPRFAFAIEHPGDAVSAFVFFLVSIAIGQLLKVTRFQYRALETRIEHVSLLEEMSRELLTLPPLEQLLGGSADRQTEWNGSLSLLQATILEDVSQTIIRCLAKVTPDPTFVFFTGRDHQLRLWGRSDTNIPLTAEEQAVAEWVFLHGEPAGAGTETLTNTPLFFLPMTSEENTIGVIGFKSNFGQFLPEQRRLLRAVANLASLSATRWVNI